ncbi:hypothetical protein GC722_03095 [Auraticoccus sp. F435]|uniref:Uncharacterized protein n=1 Tax=Auraticoccus cholistanensis TaxID=2656650 RepID=A0A6A9UR13_9ACTN|nr:hypothetical protein [Auraticoccus cholistanensis]MVA75018.1 hypothetical protein [Auraticoccus cholistanensis]
MPSERALLTSFLRSVDVGDVVALPPDPARLDQSEGHDEAREVARRRGIARPHWLFWHSQAATAFDADGQLTSALRINWGGDHARVAEVLAGLPEPFEVTSTGPDGVFLVTSTRIGERAAAPFPDVQDTAAVKARVELVAARPVAERSEAEWSWLNAVLVGGELAAQGYVVRHLVDPDRLSDEALEVLLARWPQIYGAAPADVLVWAFLRVLHRRGLPQLEEAVATSASRRGWRFQAGLAHFLTELGDPARLPLLRQLALTPGRYAHTPGNGPALRGWLRIRADHEGRPVAEVAAEALRDPAFDAAARRALEKIVQRGY